MLRPFFHTVHCISFLVLSIGALLPAGCTFRKLADQRVERIEATDTAVNINAADRRRLETLPSVGPALAEKIIEHRTRYGPFRRVEHLLLIEGVSEKRFQAIQHMITID